MPNSIFTAPTFGSGIQTWLTTPSSANLALALTDETGSGLAVFGTAPSLSAPVISGAATIGAGSIITGPGYTELAEVVTTTNVIAASESGSTYYLSQINGFTSTLPAPALGLVFRFVVKTAPTTAYIITTNSGANIIYGMFEERAGGAGVAGAAQDTQNFVASQAIIADWAEYRSDGTNWYVYGMVNVSAGVTFAVT